MCRSLKIDISTGFLQGFSTRSSNILYFQPSYTNNQKDRSTTLESQPVWTVFVARPGATVIIQWLMKGKALCILQNHQQHIGRQWAQPPKHIGFLLGWLASLRPGTVGASVLAEKRALQVFRRTLLVRVISFSSRLITE